MKVHYLVFVVIFISFNQLNGRLMAQFDFSGGIGYGIQHSKTNLNRINLSYQSYIENLQVNNPDLVFEADDVFETDYWDDAFSVHMGLTGDIMCFGMSYFPSIHRQDRRVLRSNGYGRKFSWSERRHELLFDIGFSTQFVDLFGVLGVNMNKYRMVSYQIYPDGSESLTNEFYYNGIYKSFDAGMTYGFGIRIKPIQFMAIDIRYMLASDLLLGEKQSIIEDNTTLTDNSWAKSVGTSDFPGDYNQPFSYENAIVPNFKKQYFIISLLFHFRQNG